MGYPTHLPKQSRRGRPREVDKVKLYRIARRSATECAAILDVCNKTNIIDKIHFDEGRDLLKRSIEMLTKLTNKMMT